MGNGDKNVHTFLILVHEAVRVALEPTADNRGLLHKLLRNEGEGRGGGGGGGQQQKGQIRVMLCDGYFGNNQEKREDRDSSNNNNNNSNSDANNNSNKT